jgi:hypothetical protein
MIDNFPSFAKLVAERYESLFKHSNVFVVDVDGDKFYESYLASFPEGTNQMFKKRLEHDCSTCKQVVRRAGNVVAIANNGTVLTAWDFAAKKALYPYNNVASALRDIVLAAPICDLFRVNEKETKFGSEKTISLNKESGQISSWNHFFTGEIPSLFRPKQPDTVKGGFRTTVDVFQRALEKVGPASVKTLVELLDSIYRGEEHRHTVLAFQKAQQSYLAKSEKERNIFLWAQQEGGAVTHFRTSSIGQLAVSLAEGKDIEVAVASYEAMVAPTNYKRTSAVITPGMVKKAMETIEELGLEPALERRFAVIGDVS